VRVRGSRCDAFSGRAVRDHRARPHCPRFRKVPMNTNRKYAFFVLPLIAVAIPVAAALLPVLSMIALGLVTLALPLLVIAIPFALVALAVVALSPARGE